MLLTVRVLYGIMFIVLNIVIYIVVRNFKTVSPDKETLSFLCA